ASEVSASSVGLWQPIADTLRVSHNGSSGEWWTFSGQPVAAHFAGTAYWVPGDVMPGITADPPPGAEVLGTRELVVMAAGDYTVAPVTPPHHESGYVVWQWELVDANGAFTAWRDAFGLPSETTRVSAPTLSTNADVTIPVAPTAVDTASVGG